MEIAPRRPEAALRSFVFRWTIAAKWMVCLSMDNCSEVEGLSFDGQLQRSVGKADSGMASVREGPAIAFFSTATSWTGAKVRGSRVGQAGLAAVEPGSAND
jgi:hypothetical protein